MNVSQIHQIGARIKIVRTQKSIAIPGPKTPGGAVPRLAKIVR